MIPNSTLLSLPSVPHTGNAVCTVCGAALESWWKNNQTIAGARMTISMNMVPEETIEECKRHVDECAALLERTSVPEYREAIIAMAKAWMKIAEQAKIKASR
jgi:hypothetical protein